MKDNFVIELTEQEEQEVNAAIGTLKGILLPKLVDLDGKRIMQMPKMGDKTIAFVGKTLIHMEQNPQFVPPFINVAECKKDVEGVNMLRLLKNPLEQMSEMVSDSMILCGSEALVASLAFYNSVKAAAKSNIPGADAIYNDLKTRFASSSKESEESEEK